ncbi:MAG: hypothetical protein M3121_03490, partial [Chloroflexota bacterium]|nr:hypothetical protein [Chloroflexota bacterium]
MNARRWSRREVLAAGAGALSLGLAGCANDEPDAPTTEVSTTLDTALTPMATQLPPTPTQPPLTSPVAGY